MLFRSGEAGARRSKARGGGRSSGSSGRSAAVHGGVSGEALRPPGVTRSTVTRSVAAAVARAVVVTWTAARRYGHGEGRGYSAGTEKRREGNGAGAHGGLDGVVGELGDALETVGPRRRSPAAGDEDDGDGGAPGRSGLRGSAEGFSARRRSSGTRRRCEGMAGSAGQRTAATGAFGRRGRERERGAGERE